MGGSGAATWHGKPVTSNSSMRLVPLTPRVT